MWKMQREIDKGKRINHRLRSEFGIFFYVKIILTL